LQSRDRKETKLSFKKTTAKYKRQPGEHCCEESLIPLNNGWLSNSDNYKYNSRHQDLYSKEKDNPRRDRVYTRNFDNTKNKYNNRYDQVYYTNDRRDKSYHDSDEKYQYADDDQVKFHKEVLLNLLFLFYLLTFHFILAFIQ
jgi:hypothetical protein